MAAFCASSQAGNIGVPRQYDFYFSVPELKGAGDEDTAAVCEVIDFAPAGDGTIVHLRLLPGLVEDYRALVERALAS